MAYVPVIVCLEALSDLNAAFAPFDRCQSVPVYRAYETGHPSKHWAVDQLRKQTRLSPNVTTLTWAQFADAYNADVDDEDRLHIDDAGRAYVLSEKSPQGEVDGHRLGGCMSTSRIRYTPCDSRKYSELQVGWKISTSPPRVTAGYSSQNFR